MILFDEFIAKYTGKFVEYHSYGAGALYQCVDCVNQYIVEVLGKQAIIGTNAQDVPSKVSKDDYDYILNTPTGVPSKGDIVIFKSADKVGHISIFIEGNTNLFTSFEQNYPTGSPCKKVNHNYVNVLGWLKPKAKTNDALATCLKLHGELVNKCNEKDTRIAELEQKLTEVEATLGSTNKARKEAEDKLVKCEAKVLELTPLATEWDVLSKMYNVTNATDMDKIVRTLKEEIANPDTISKTECNRKINDKQEVIDGLRTQIIELKKNQKKASWIITQFNNLWKKLKPTS